MIIYDKITQGSEEWERLRAGKITASRFSDIITSVKGDLSKSARKYAIELVSQCYCPGFVGFFGTPYTDRGTELEPDARRAFTEHTGKAVEEVGFILRDDKIVGCSPDGMIRGADGQFCEGLELKVPAPKTHVEYILDGVLPDSYRQQCHGGLAVTGLDTWNFFSFSPGMRPFHCVVRRDEYTDKLSRALDDFIVLYNDLYQQAKPLLQPLEANTAD